MYKKFYSINNLEKYEDNAFIYERKSINEEIIYSYKTIIHEINKCKGFLDKYQVEHHVGVAVDLKEHSASACVLLLAILNHECNFYCLDLEETKDVAIYLKTTGVKYVISQQNLEMDSIPKQTNDGIIILKENYYLYRLQNLASNFENFTKCYTIATSGSTGVPKMVHVPYECIEPNINALSHLLNIQQNDIIFLSSPPTFDPFVVEFFMSLENGAGLLITTKEIRLQPQLLLKIIFPEMATLQQGVTVYQTTPSLFRLFGKHSIKSVILNKNSTLRHLILGGEEFPDCYELESWLPTDYFSTGKCIFNIYGITEISCWSSIYEIDTNTKLEHQTRVPLGKALDKFTYFRVVDKDGNVCYHNDCKGELEIGSSVRYCYIPQDDLDVKNVNGKDIIYRKTGDLVERDRNGNIYYIGRTSNTIKRLGKRLCLDSLSKKVQNILHGNNMYFHVSALWNKDSSNLIFYVVNSTKLLGDEKESMINVLRETLENHEQPDKIFYNKNLPINCHGKVDRKKIFQQIFMPGRTPVSIFKDFVTNVMGLQLDMARSEVDVYCSKRLKLSSNLSFTKAGATSFQALSLATEIGELMEETNEQRKILEMFLDNNVTIADILAFLMSCSKKSEFDEMSNTCSKTIDTKFNLKLRWRRDLKKCIDATPSIYDNKFVLVGSHSHLLLTANAINGEEISCIEFNDRIECPVVFATSNLALVGCYDGFLYGFDFNNGTISWKLNAQGLIKAKLLLINNMVIVASYAKDYNILAFDIESLALMWCLKLGSKGIFSSPLQVNNESVLFCNLDGTYALIEAYTGSIKWLQKLDTPIFSTASKLQMANENFLILAEVKGKISICQAGNGERITSYQTEGNVFSGLTLHQPDHKNYSLIIFGCHDKHVYCLKMVHTDKQLTLFSKVCLNSAIYSTPIVILKRYILTCSTKGLIVLCDIQKNTVLASTDLKAEVFSTPICLNDKYIYVGSRDNYLYCFEIDR